MEETKKNHKMIGIIAAVIIVITATAVIYMQTAGKESKVQKDLELASQYLDELDYEQAIAVYEQVLSIDPKNQEALIGDAKAYTGLAEQQEDAEQAIQSMEQAVAYAEQVYDLYPEEVAVQEVIVTVYMQAGDLCVDAERYEEADVYYEKAVSLELDENLGEKQEEAARKTEEAKELLEEQRRQEEIAERAKEYEVLLQPVLEAWQSGDIQTINGMISSQKYKEIASELQEGESIYCGEYGIDNQRNGVGVAVYRINNIATFYIGEWKNNKRDGEAYWSGNIFYWSGNWMNDLPNGKMKGIVKNPSEDVTEEWSEGSVVNGLWDGIMTSGYICKEVLTEDNITYTKGIVETFGRDKEGYYVISYSTWGLPHAVIKEEYLDKTWGVWGFAEIEG